MAMTLLGWRDALVGLGWNPSDYTKSQKLNALMDIEKHFDCAGVADCKRELLETLQAGRADLSGITIESVLPEGMLPCYFAALLSAAHKCGAEVVYSPAPSAAAAEGTRLRALQEYLLSGKAIDLSKIDDEGANFGFKELNESAQAEGITTSTIKNIKKTYFEYVCCVVVYWYMAWS